MKRRCLCAGLLALIFAAGTVLPCYAEENADPGVEWEVEDPGAEEEEAVQEQDAPEIQVLGVSADDPYGEDVASGEDTSGESYQEAVDAYEAGLSDDPYANGNNGEGLLIEQEAPEISVEPVTEQSADGLNIQVDEIEVMEPLVYEEEKVLLEPVRVSVHDPSVFEDPHSGTFYVFGSHTASASSQDLAAWNQISFDYSSPDQTPFYGNLKENLAKPFEWAGYDDGDATGGYAVWAPDMIWNPYYQWEDGSTGAYMLYFCTSSTWRRSCIGYLVSRSLDETFTFADMIVYSGFTKNGKPDGNSKRDTGWDNDYLNLKSLVELGAENGGIDEISEKWFTSDGGWDNTYAPNAIDPNVFFDADGQKLYMSYGSWSGGLFLLELDPATGRAYYPGADSVDEISGNYIDRYFGVHLAGGNHQSGEGPYIKYDPETGYYYLYCTYGGLQAEGGYNMRMFRSVNPTGPYLDAAGNNAADNKDGIDGYGIKLIGNYSFYNQIGKRAAGHNSQLLASDGSRYLVYHQRFEIDPQLEAHEVRVHQQFLNEDNWPVTAVYEYRGEQPEHYSIDAVVGSYEFINHGLKTNGEMLETRMLNLNEDGTADGAASGTWSMSDSGRGYDYVTLELDGIVYKGFLFLQHKENTETEPVMTFSAVGTDNTCIWGSRIDSENTEMMAEMAAIALTQQIPQAARENLNLPAEVMGCSVTWSSEDESVITSEGVVIPQAEDSRVVLHAAITNGSAVKEQTFKVTVRQTPVLVASYLVEEGAAAEDGTIPADSGAALTESAQLVGAASLAEDPERGMVLSISNEAGSVNGSYLKLPEDTLHDIGPAGYSVTMWVKIGADTFEHSALFEADADGAYPLTRIGANLIARINANAYSDVMGSLLTTSGEREVWEHVAYTVDPYGIKVYLNGELVGQEDKNIKDCFKKNKTGISQAKNVMVGAGWIWGDEDCRQALFDDIRVYDGVLTGSEIADLAVSSQP